MISRNQMLCMFYLNACLPKPTSNGRKCEKTEYHFILFQWDMLPYYDGRFFFAQFLCHQLCGPGPKASQIIPQRSNYLDRSWLCPWILATFFAQCYFWSAIWGTSMYLHDSLVDLPQMLVVKLILQWLDHTYIKFQAFSKVKSCYKILQNITRIHLPSALVYFATHDIVSIVDGFVWHRSTPLWMPLIAHSQGM